MASDIFKDKKDNYPQSVAKLFVGTRLSKCFSVLIYLFFVFVKNADCRLSANLSCDCK